MKTEKSELQLSSDLNSETNNFETSWQDYWKEFGHNLVLDSWTARYGEYLSPNYKQDRSQEVKSSNFNYEIFSEDNQALESVNSDWKSVWEIHLEEQYSFYYDWFFTWWTTSQNQPDTTQEATVCKSESVFSNNQSQLDLLDTAFEGLLIETHGTMNSQDLGDAECHGKTVVQKTKEFLDRLGFSNSLIQPGTIITDCTLISNSTKKRKKKKKKMEQNMKVCLLTTCNYTIQTTGIHVYNLAKCKQLVV